MKMAQMFHLERHLGEKYSDPPGVRNLHNFLFIKVQNGEVVMMVREFCFGGAWKVSLLDPKNTALYSAVFLGSSREGYIYSQIQGQILTSNFK